MKWRSDGGRGDLTNRQWQKLQPLLPPQKAHTGQPAYYRRRILNGILWLHRTGAPVRDIPERYGNHRTISSRFYRWFLAGVWQKVWSSLMQQADLQGIIDWEVNFERQHYSSSTPALLWSKRGEPEAQALGLTLWWF